MTKLMTGNWTKMDEEELMNEDIAPNPRLIEERRGSVDTRKKVSWAQKLNPRLMFSKGTKSGTTTPNDYSRLSNLKEEEKKFRSQSIDLGGTLISPLSGYKTVPMFRQNEEPIADDTEADREVHSISNRKFLVVPPPGTAEYTVSGNDTLASIAAKHRSTTSELAKINKLMSPLVFPGQKLHVPTDGYVPVGYGSRSSSPRTSPKPRSGSYDHSAEMAAKAKSSADSDEAKKQKKTKNLLKDRRPSEALEGFFRGNKNLFQKEEAPFKAEVEYVTGGQDPNVSGLLEITRCEVQFEPDLGGAGKGVLKDLVRYRMALGKALISANIVDDNPFSPKAASRKASNADGVTEIRSEEEMESSPTEKENGKKKRKKQKKKDSESEKPADEKATVAQGSFAAMWNNYVGQEAISFNADAFTGTTEQKDQSQIEPAAISEEWQEKPNDDETTNVTGVSVEVPTVKYLLLKLGIPPKAGKDRPTISSLVKGSLPFGSATYEHCFVIPNPIVDDLIDFLQRNYPNVYGKSTDASESADSFDEGHEGVIMRPPTEKGRAGQFKRTLSVAELCNLPLPEMSHQSSILSETHIRILLEHLLPKAEGRPWKLAYSSSLHGYSINTLYRSMVKSDDLTTLVTIHDMEDKVFGAMLPCSVRQSDGFYGSGESFLFTFYPVFKKFCWSGKNSCFLKGGPQSFCIGASDGVFGLWLHDDLNHGRTQRCETFDNDPLTGAAEDFYMRCVEIWQFPFSL